MPITIVGGPELHAKFRQLEAAVATRVIRPVVDAAADAAVEAAKGLAPQRTGALGESITKKGSGNKRDIGYGQFYGTFVMKGTGTRHKKSTGQSTGSMPQTDFLTPALSDSRVELEAQGAFEREMARLGAI